MVDPAPGLSNAQGAQPRPDPAPQVGQRPPAVSRSRFNFRAERGNWLALLGLIIAVLAIPSLVYTVWGYEQSEWANEKAFWDYCQGLKAVNEALPKACIGVIDRVPPPPPHHSAAFFTRTAKIAKRTVEGHQQQVANGDSWDYGRWVTGIFSFYLIQDSFLYHKTMPKPYWNYQSTLPQRTIRVPRAPGKQMVELFFSRGVWRSTALLASWIGPDVIDPSTWPRVLTMGPWTLLHVVWFRKSRSHWPGRLPITETCAYWALNGYYNSVISDNYNTIPELLLRLCGIWTTFFFAGLSRDSWPEGFTAADIRRVARDFEFSFIPAMCGSLLTWSAGVLVFRDAIFGCAFMAVQGFWIPWGQKQTPMLNTTQVPLAVVFSVWYVCACIHDYRHGRGVFQSLRKSH